MFGIGSAEFLLILIVALVVLGPDHLPKIVRTFSKVRSEFRKVSTDLQRAINVEAQLEDAVKPQKKKAASAQGKATAKAKPKATPKAEDQAEPGAKPEAKPETKPETKAEAEAEAPTVSEPLPLYESEKNRLRRESEQAAKMAADSPTETVPVNETPAAEAPATQPVTEKESAEGPNTEGAGRG